jgi:hypothetical protein
MKTLLNQTLFSLGGKFKRELSLAASFRLLTCSHVICGSNKSNHSTRPDFELHPIFILVAVQSYLD